MKKLLKIYVVLIAVAIVAIITSINANIDNIEKSSVLKYSEKTYYTTKHIDKYDYVDIKVYPQSDTSEIRSIIVVTIP